MIAAMSALNRVVEKPSYDGGNIVNLMASIVSATGGEPQYQPVGTLDESRLAKARHIVLIVVDGLGFELLNASPAGAALRRHLSGSLTSVFPPTTAAAVTTFLTGLAPQQHGLTGWFMFMRMLGSVVTILPFTMRLGSVPLASLGVNSIDLLGHTPVFDLIGRASFSVAPAEIAHSEFNRSHSGRAEIRPYTD